MIAIVDYGMGNIHSVQKALESLGAKTLVTNKAKEIALCGKVVLPGVGAFDDAMQELEKKKLIVPLKEHIRKKKPLLGICLGMQILFEESQEAVNTKGLGILKGKVVKFKEKKDLKVPHIGWNQLKIDQRLKTKDQSICPLLKGIPDNSYVYFCHSYYPQAKDKNISAAATDYGADSTPAPIAKKPSLNEKLVRGFTSVVWQDNVYGTQFHPEKSQGIGLKILANFINLC